MKIANGDNYMPRLVDKIIDEYLSIAKAVCVEGPKWCGKTWTSSYHSNSEFLVWEPGHNFQNWMLS